MSSTEEKLKFEQMPQAVSEIKAEILCLKGIINEGRAKTQAEIDTEALEYVRRRKGGVK